MLHIGYIESSEEFNDYELFDQDNEVEYNISNDSESDDDDNKKDSDKNDRSSDNNTNNYSIHDNNHKNDNDNDTNYKCVDKIDFENDHINKSDLLR